MSAQNVNIKNKPTRQAKPKNIYIKPVKIDHNDVITQLSTTIKILNSKNRHLMYENKHLNKRLKIAEKLNKALKKDKEMNTQLKCNFDIVLRNRNVQLNSAKINVGKLSKEIIQYKKEQLHDKNDIKNKTMLIDHCQLYRVNNKAHKHNNNAMILNMKQTNEQLKRSILQRGEELHKEKQINHALQDEVQKLMKQMEIILLNKNDNSSTSLGNNLRHIFLSVESHHKHFTKHPSKESYPKHSDESIVYLPKDSLENLVYDNNLENPEWLEKLTFP